MNSPVVLLDEPTRGLDYRAERALAVTLRALATEGRTVLVSAHDVEFTALAADEVVVLAEGEVVASGPVRRVVAESPAFGAQVTKILGPPWLRVDEVVAAMKSGTWNAPQRLNAVPLVAPVGGDPGRRLARRADDAGLAAAAAPCAADRSGGTRRSCSWRCCRSSSR